MKPKIFIGSSVEGLSIAYAVQNNLQYDGDVTVWNQGVFELSKTTIESLNDLIENTDFGIFVFSPDDITKIRDKMQNTVRDNVIFELGLFIGKLTRKRTFIIIPDKTELHIPTDLIGITPGKFEINREDGNLEAATAPACHQIRNQIARVGLLNIKNIAQDSTEKKDAIPEEPASEDWIISFSNKDYKKAIELLNEKIKSEKDEKKNLENIVYRLYCEFMMGGLNRFAEIDTFLNEHKELNAYVSCANFLIWENYFDKALEIIDKGLGLFPNDSKLIFIKSRCYEEKGENERAIKIIDNPIFYNDEKLVLRLVNLYTESSNQQQAKQVLQIAYNQIPNSEKIQYEYAIKSSDLNEFEIALFLLHKLTIEYSENYLYWAYLSNVCVSLNLPDLAFSYCKKADELAKGKEAWIIANLGNILNNQELQTEAVSFLKKSIQIDNNSEYSYKRLSEAMKKQEEQQKKMQELIKVGKAKINSALNQEINVDIEPLS